MTDFNFDEYKQTLKKQIRDKMKIEISYFEDIISDYKTLSVSKKGTHEKFNINISKDNRNSFTSSKSTTQNLVNDKFIELEKENNLLMKENKGLNTKLLEVISENMKIKEQLLSQNQHIISKNELIKNLQSENTSIKDELFKVNADITILKNTNSQLENINIDLSQQLKSKFNENSNLINEILTIKNDYATKMNEMLEMFDEAKAKKEAADMYYSSKKDDYISSTKFSEMSSKLDEFKIVVEETKIPNKIKLKMAGHRKNITDISFNAFGSNFITASADFFIKNWDASKSKTI